MVYLFDIDGTLIRSPRGVGRQALDRAIRDAVGLEGAMEGVELAGHTDPFIVEQAFRLRLGRAPTAAERDAVMEAYLGCLREALAAEGSVLVLPWVRETLEALGRRGAVLGLATGNVEAGARLKLARAGLWDEFAFGGYGSDSHLRGELVRAAIRRAEAVVGGPVDPAEVTVIGDTPRDVAAAREAGARAVAVATGSSGVDALRATGADEVHATLETFLERL